MCSSQIFVLATQSERKRKSARERARLSVQESECERYMRRKRTERVRWRDPCITSKRQHQQTNGWTTHLHHWQWGKNGNARNIAFLPEILLQLSITPSSFRSLSFTQTTHIHTRPEKSRVKNEWVCVCVTFGLKFPGFLFLSPFFLLDFKFYDGKKQKQSMPTVQAHAFRQFSKIEHFFSRICCWLNSR